MDSPVIQQVAIEVLKNTPPRPFLCLPMSAAFYAILKDRHAIETKLVTGNLLYEGQYIFKQDYKIAASKDAAFQEWSGHSWVELDGSVYDLSFFRTLYSKEFTKPSKTQLIAKFGKGRGCLIANQEQLARLGFKYEPVDYLDDSTATGIIKGFPKLLEG